MHWVWGTSSLRCQLGRLDPTPFPAQQRVWLLHQAPDTPQAPKQAGVWGAAPSEDAPSTQIQLYRSIGGCVNHPKSPGHPPQALCPGDEGQRPTAVPSAQPASPPGVPISP